MNEGDYYLVVGISDQLEIMQVVDTEPTRMENVELCAYPDDDSTIETFGPINLDDVAAALGAAECLLAERDRLEIQIDRRTAELDQLRARRDHLRELTRSAE